MLIPTLSVSMRVGYHSAHNVLINYLFILGVPGAPLQADNLADAAGSSILPPAQLHPPGREAGEYPPQLRRSREAVRFWVREADQ